MGDCSQTDAVLREIAARIIQHHFSAFRKRHTAAGPPPGRAFATAGGAGGCAQRPRTPPAAQPPSAGSVLDFMPGGMKGRPATSGRPASRPPRPRAPSARPAGAQAPPAREAPAAGPGEHKPAENSGECMNRKAAAGLAAAPAGPAISAAAKPVSSPPSAELPHCTGACVGSDSQCAVPPSSSSTQQQQQPTRSRTVARQLDMRASASTEKMGHIMRLIEQLEKQAVEEARQVAAPHQAGGEAAGRASPRAATGGVGAAAAATARQPPPQVHPLARVMAAQPLSIGSRQMLAAAASDATAAQAEQAAASSKLVRKTACLLHTPAPVTATGCSSSSDSKIGSSGTAEQSATASTPASAAPAANTLGGVRQAQAQQVGADAQAQISAAMVASSVRAKIQQLQAAVVEKDNQLAALRQRVAAVQSQHEAALRAAEEEHKAAIASQKAEAEAAASRSLQFIDRVMADKDALSEKCTKLAKELASLQGEAVKQIEALKEGLARELRKQKEVWVAAERTKREAWMADQTRSIKEATIKGLEPEIQRLVEVHKGEMKRAEQRHETELARRLAAAAVQHEEAVAALRAQWAAERAAAVEAERAAAREQVKDAQGRFEVELQSLRMRLAAEHQMQLDRADAARREDQARLQQAAQEYEQRAAALRADWEVEKAQLVKQGQREAEAVRQQYESNQEAWRAAASERARREMESREAALRRQLADERDEELAAVVARLEEDALAKEAALQKQLEAGEAAAHTHWRDEVERLRASEASLSEQRAAAEARAEAASAKIERLEELVHTLQKEVSSKGSSLAWLEDQLAAAKREAASRQEAGAAALAAAQERHAADRAALEQAAAAAQAAADHAAQEAAALRQRRVQEMEELQGRFTTLLSTKDRTIASLTQQLQELHAVLS